MSKLHLIIILSCVLLSTSAQLVLKVGADKLAPKFDAITASQNSLAMLLGLFNWYLLIGLLMYFFSAAAWVWVLSKVDISIAYPFVSLGFVLTLVFGAMCFDEPLNVSKVAGVAFILLGCVFIARA